MSNEREEPTLSEKDQEIIAVGASVASGCLPCTKFHLRAAAGSGATAEEILQAVRDATWVRRAATEIMASAGGLPSAEVGQIVRPVASEGPLVRQLVAISAAYAVSCSTGLEAHMAAARALGATDRQIFAALEIACRIRDVANQKARSVAGAILGRTDDEAGGCGCADGDGASDCVPGGDACSCGSDGSAATKQKGTAR